MAGIPPGKGQKRFVIDIDEDIYNRLRKHLTIQGSQRAFFVVVLRDMLDLMDQYGPAFIAAVLERKLRADQVVSNYLEGLIPSGDTEESEEVRHPVHE